MSSKEDIAFRKLSMLMKAVTEANERETLKNTAQSTFSSEAGQLSMDGERIDCGASGEATGVFYGCCSLEELKAAAFEVLLLHPGSDFTKWVETLMRQYGTELTDAYGTDPAKIHASLQKLWQTPYRDVASGQARDYKTWAEAFATRAAAEMYYAFVGNNRGLE